VIDEIDRLYDVGMRRDVVVAELEALTTEMLDVLQRTGIEVVDADHAEIARDQMVAEVRAEESRASGDNGGRHLGGC